MRDGAVIDVHTHLYAEPDFELEWNLSSYDVSAIATDYAERLDESPVEHAVAIVMDEEFLDDDGAVSDLLAVRDEYGSFSPVFLIDPFRDDATELVDRIGSMDGAGIKLHPYQQRLGDRDDFPRIARVLGAVEDNDLVTIIDAAYGETRMYNYNGVRLGHAMAKVVDSPILLAHGGASEIFEAFSAAVTFENIYLDTSFSVPYWEGSSLIQDYAFAMEKMEMDKWMWGTDMPYMGPDESLDAAEQLLTDHGLDHYAEDFFYDNAAALFDL